MTARPSRLPWTTPEHSTAPSGPAEVLLSAGDPWGHALLMTKGWSQRAGITWTILDPARPSADEPPLSPVMRAGEHHCDDPIAIARELAPSLFPLSDKPRLEQVRNLLDQVTRLKAIDHQGAYESEHLALAQSVQRFETTLSSRRYLEDAGPSFADLLLFAFSVRLDLVYFELHKASIGRLSDFAALEAHAQDLFEHPKVAEATDVEAIKAHHYGGEPVLNPRGILPRGGLPDLDAPHDRAFRFTEVTSRSGVEEDPDKARSAGEWVRPVSGQRHAVGSERFPAEPGRYHLYAPFNCPWSHRALLGRAVKGLQDMVGASIVYFRRHPERGWQFNPAIPGCTGDLAEGHTYIESLYQSVDSSERSVPILWDTATKAIVSNESAEILRMFNDAFSAIAPPTLDLLPAEHRETIEWLNAIIYPRINNGAYKAGFASSQGAYDRAFARYFRALDWVDARLQTRDFLAGTNQPTEADLRLFPTVFRHDAVYYARFKLNLKTIADYPHLARWQQRMLDVPGVHEASNLDHARNGYFGRTGNEIVPAGPIPLQLSAKDFRRDVWLNEA